MATPETKVKQALARRDQKVAKLAELAYRRLTFGPNSAVGLPDTRREFGAAHYYTEIKREGAEPTVMQTHQLAECQRFGVPAIAVCGETGVARYYEQVYGLFSDVSIELRMERYRQDCQMLRRALLEVK